MAGLEAMMASFRLSKSLEDLTKVCSVGVVESAESRVKDVGRGMHEKDARR